VRDDDFVSSDSFRLAQYWANRYDSTTAAYSVPAEPEYAQPCFSFLWTAFMPLSYGSDERN